MPSLVANEEDIVMFLEFLDDGRSPDEECQQQQPHSNVSKMSQQEASIIEYDIAEVHDGKSTQHDITWIELVTKIDDYIENESCQAPPFSLSPSVKHQGPIRKETHFPYDIGNYSAAPCSYNQQQELSGMMESSDCLVDDLIISPCSRSPTIERMHSLAGNPLPQATISSRAPPPSTLCPHALKYKFPEKYGDLLEESNEEFLMRCLRQTSLDFLM